jgi:hypothetical protein
VLFSDDLLPFGAHKKADKENTQHIKKMSREKMDRAYQEHPSMGKIILASCL